MKTVLLALLVLIVACAPAVQRTPEEEAAYQQQLQAQREKQARIQRIQAAGLYLKAECYARDGQQRVNRLQQGMNLCVLKTLTHPDFGEIQRARVIVQYDYANKQPVSFMDVFGASDEVWNGNRVAVTEQILMPDSVTGVLFSGGVGLSKVGVIAVYESHFGFLNIVGWDLTRDPRIAPYLDIQGNMKSMNSRLSNLGTRPMMVRARLEVCSDICMQSGVISFETR